MVRKPSIKWFSRYALGGSDYPIKELRIAGVDLEKPEVVSNALKEFGNSVDELEKLLGQLK